ncbi:transposase [Myroides odoratus]|uniref:transposase n=1 Tax=Myroides odoratus TaxID=256 RepID=UPI000765D91F|nr:transposase [Myroides odoratus]
MNYERIRKTYDPTFKQQVVKLAKEKTNKSELARELRNRATLLYKWCKDTLEFGEGSFPDNGKQKLTPEQKRIKKLKKKLATVELEHEILKKVIALFLKPGK